ncbi:MAG: hypothetical protein ACFFCW_38925, partial [Candidatus Hodarchaeota archaeon]
KIQIGQRQASECQEGVMFFKGRRTLPRLRHHHRAGPGPKPRHLILPPMPAPQLWVSDIKAVSGWICTSDQRFPKPLFHLQAPAFWNSFSKDFYLPRSFMVLKSSLAKMLAINFGNIMS